MSPVMQTIDRLIKCMMNEKVQNKLVIDDWLLSDSKALDMTIELMQHLKSNGWDYNNPFNNYLDKQSRKLCHELYKRAVDFVNIGRS